MSDLYLTLKLAHIVGATLLFGTGLGIAFFMFLAQRTHDPVRIAHTARSVVIADAMFVATAVVTQLITGFGMAWLVGLSTYHFWIAASLILYAFVGMCWLPAVWLQIQMRNIAAAAARDGTPLPPRFHRLYRVWFWLGWPAFGGVIAIFALMIWKPQW